MAPLIMCEELPSLGSGLVPENARSLVVGDPNLTFSFLGSFLLLHQLGLLKDSLNLLKALKVSCFFY